MRVMPRALAGMVTVRVVPALAGTATVVAAPLAICSLTCWAVAWWAWTLAIRVSRSGASKTVSGSAGLAARRAAWVVAKALDAAGGGLYLGLEAGELGGAVGVGGCCCRCGCGLGCGGDRGGVGVGVAFCHVGRILG